MSAFKLHWYVDHNTGISACGAGANGVAVPVMPDCDHEVTCERCKRLPEWSYAARESRQRWEWALEAEAQERARQREYRSQPQQTATVLAFRQRESA